MHTRAVKTAQNLSVAISRSNCCFFFRQDGNVNAQADVSWIFCSQSEAITSLVSKFKSQFTLQEFRQPHCCNCNHARLPHHFVPQNCVLIVIAHRGCWVGVLSGGAMGLSQYRCWKFSVGCWVPTVWCGKKTRMVWPPDCLTVCLAVWLTDGRTDGRTWHLAYVYTSRGKNRNFRQIYRFSSEMIRYSYYGTLIGKL